MSTRSFATNSDTLKPGPSHFHSASLPHLLPSYFIDHSGHALHLYGGVALEVFDAPPTHGKQQVEELHFHFIEYDEIAPHLGRLAAAFPHVNVRTCSLDRD